MNELETMNSLAEPPACLLRYTRLSDALVTMSPHRDMNCHVPFRRVGRFCTAFSHLPLTQLLHVTILSRQTAIDLTVQPF